MDIGGALVSSFLLCSLDHTFPLRQTDFSRAIELDPKNAIYHHNRGLCFRNMSKYKSAVKDFSMAIKHNPNASAYNSRGYAWRKLGNLYVCHP